VYRTEADARENAKESAAGVRLQRMAEMTGGGSMVTLSSLATMDEDVESMQRLNLIIKVRPPGRWAGPQARPAPGR
jgi:translation initiation factor IF-2